MAEVAGSGAPRIQADAPTLASLTQAVGEADVLKACARDAARKNTRTTIRYRILFIVQSSCNYRSGHATPARPSLVRLGADQIARRRAELKSRHRDELRTRK